MKDSGSTDKKHSFRCSCSRISTFSICGGCCCLGCLLLTAAFIGLSVIGIRAVYDFAGHWKKQFFPATVTTVTDEFQTFAEKRIPVSKLILLERRSREKVTRKIDQTYSVPWLEQYALSGHASVNIRCPVMLQYYVNLDEKWRLELHDSHLVVVAPPIRIGTPVIDMGNVEREINGSWLIFGEEQMLRQLEKELQVELRCAAMQPINLECYRDDCRRSLEKFIRTWLVGSNYHVNNIEIIFSGEKKNVSAFLENRK